MDESERRKYVLQMAAQLGLNLPEEEIARVLPVLGNLERLADQLREVPITDDTIAAAVFCPSSGLLK